MSDSPLELRARIDALYVNDKASQALGMIVTNVALGWAQAQMTVREDMANGFGICHGGFVFALADSTFGYASNTHGHPMVAAGASIEYVAPTSINDRLTATASETHRSERHGIYDVLVAKHTGEVVAYFRGRCSRMRTPPKPAASEG